MVALRLQKYADDLPQIGKVVNLTDMDVTVEWWIGSTAALGNNGRKDEWLSPRHFYEMQLSTVG